MQSFHDVSIDMLLDPKLLNGAKRLSAYYLYMFGATDMVAQSFKLTKDETLELYDNLLQSGLFDLSSSNAKLVLNAVRRQSATHSGMEMMKEGGDNIQYWIEGAKYAPHRLQEILSSIQG